MHDPKDDIQFCISSKIENDQMIFGLKLENGKTCIMNWLSCIRLLLANWLRSSGMHDKNNGQSLSHLKWACSSDSSPSSASIDSTKPMFLNESIASAFDLLIVIVTLCIYVSLTVGLFRFMFRTYINLNGFTHPVKRFNPRRNGFIGISHSIWFKMSNL